MLPGLRQGCFGKPKFGSISTFLFWLLMLINIFTWEISVWNFANKSVTGWVGVVLYGFSGKDSKIFRILILERG